MHPDQSIEPKAPCRELRPSTRLIHIFLLIGLGFWVYHNNYDHAYNLDDTYGLMDNVFVRSLKHIPRYFVEPLTLTAYLSNVDYRPVLQVTYALNYWISGYDTWSWHLLQILLHLIVAISMYGFVGRIQTAFAPLIRVGRFWYPPLWIAVAAVLHPTASGVVNYFWARSSLLVAALLVPAFWSYLDSREKRRFPGLALALFTLALFSKVEAIAGIVVLLLLDTLLYRRDSIDVRTGFFANLCGAALKVRSSPLKWFAVMSVGYFIIRAVVLPDFAEEMRHDAQVTAGPYFFTQLTAWWYYLWKWFAPLGLVADHTNYPVFWSLWDPTVLLAAGGWLVTAGLTLQLWRHRPDLAFFVASAIVLLSPTSSVAPLAEMVNEHRPYLPLTMASVVWVTFLFESVQITGRHRNLALKGIVGAGILIVCWSFSQLTLERNLVFKTNESYAADVVKKSPSARSYLNYGLVFLKKGEIERARSLFLQAADYAPNWFITQINLGIAEDALGNPDVAMKYFDRAVELEKYTTLALQYRAAAWEKRHNFDEAIKDLKKAVQLAPTDCQAIQKWRATLERAGRSVAETDDYMKTCI